MGEPLEAYQELTIPRQKTLVSGGYKVRTEIPGDLHWFDFASLFETTQPKSSARCFGTITVLQDDFA